MTTAVQARHGWCELFCGKSGTGKTHLLRTGLAKLPRWIVIDTKPDHYQIAFSDALYCESVGDFFDHVDEHGTWGRVVINAPDAEIPALLAFAYDCGDCIVVLEEVDAYCTSRSHCPDFLRDALKRGRSKGLHLIMTTQRPADVPTTITSRVDCMTVFGRDWEVSDREHFARRLGKNAERIDLHERFTFTRFRL